MHALAAVTAAVWLGTAAVNAQKPIAAAESALPAAQESEQNWWRSAVIYEIYPRSFQALQTGRELTI